MMVGKQRKNLVPALPIIISMSPLGYPSAWLHPCRARLRFTWRSYCSSAPSISLNLWSARDTLAVGFSMG